MDTTTTRRARAAAITFALVLVGITVGCGRTANPRDWDEVPDCATTANSAVGGLCRPDPNRVGVGTTPGSRLGTTPDAGDRTTTSTAPAKVPDDPGTASQLGTSPRRDAIEQLERHRAAWAARHPVAYRYTFRNGCFCPPAVTGPFLVTVRVDTQVIEVGEPGGAEPARTVDPGIDAVFRSTRDALEHAEQVQVAYDPTFGFPALLAVDDRLDTGDDESRVTISGFTALP